MFLNNACDYSRNHNYNAWREKKGLIKPNVFVNSDAQQALWMSRPAAIVCNGCIQSGLKAGAVLALEEPTASSYCLEK